MYRLSARTLILNMPPLSAFFEKWLVVSSQAIALQLGPTAEKEGPRLQKQAERPQQRRRQPVARPLPSKPAKTRMLGSTPPVSLLELPAVLWSIGTSRQRVRRMTSTWFGQLTSLLWWGSLMVPLGWTVGVGEFTSENTAQGMLLSWTASGTTWFSWRKAVRWRAMWMANWGSPTLVVTVCLVTCVLEIMPARFHSSAATKEP